MRTAEIIAAHKDSLTERPPDRRAELIACWESYRRGGVPRPVVELALQLVDGNVNEVELAFYTLMDLALADHSLFCHVRQLAKHRSAVVRRSLAFYLSREFPSEACRSVYDDLLGDKAASVRVRTIESICMREYKWMLPALDALRSKDKNSKVVNSLDYWIPLLAVGYRVDPTEEPGRLRVTALTGNGVAATTVEARDADDPRITAMVSQLRAPHARIHP